MQASVLWNRHLLSVLSWGEIDDILLSNEERRLLIGGSYFDDLEDELRRKSERELFRYRSRHGLLDIERIDVELFKLQFRFEKEDFGELASALLLPQAVVSAQNVTVPGQTALCLTLRRLAYPNRWCDLKNIFGLHASVMSSVASKMFCHITSNFGHLLDDCNNHSWLSPFFALIFLQAVARKGAPLRNCWAFIDGTARPICRPKRNQEQYYSGHKRCHCVKYQSVMCPNSIICQLDGPYPGRRHDAGILESSGLYSKLERLVKDDDFVVYGDPAYPLLPLVMKPYGGNTLTPAQQAFNRGMSSKS
ncbi:uncharacterized protein LOC125757829 [Rhipicephalus sanguineus]|uniref:uncharacterized protein LOC125757829 n=1 Tax=Rhipicephalus sanguineus TaxID=34632 RepID=UPI0020C4C716|nr:uncharacterized protein LOC125757829 [Rhipicephalus sanguineus]